MGKTYRRKDFLKMALMAPIGLQAGNWEFIQKKFSEKTRPSPGPGNVTYYKSGDEQYETLRKGFNKRIDKRPALIALCFNAEGVSEAIQLAEKNKWPVAIKSGGHCMEGYSVNEGGMCINLSQLNQILWLNKNTIQVGPGCTLSRIYDEILPKGKYLPGGSCAGVGIGGLVLGGGYGLMGRKFGLTCDSLLELTMVDGSGNIHKAAPGDELLWACKGGGNGNFGVVTGLTFKLHEAPKLMQSHRFKIHNTDPARAITALQKWFGLVSDLPNECFSAFVLNRKTVYILLTNASGSNTAIQKTITALSAITDKTTHTSAKPLATALKVFYGRPDPLHFKNASAGLYKGFDDIASCIEKVIPMVMASPGMIYQVNTLGGNIRNPEFEKLSSFPHRAYPYFSELQTYWETESQEPQRIKRFREVQSLFNNSGIVAQYRNYPDNDFTQWERLYYGGNYNRLQQIKNKYDPRNLFRYEQSIKNT